MTLSTKEQRSLLTSQVAKEMKDVLKEQEEMLAKLRETNVDTKPKTRDQRFWNKLRKFSISSDTFC